MNYNTNTDPLDILALINVPVHEEKEEKEENTLTLEQETILSCPVETIIQETTVEIKEEKDIQEVVDILQSLTQCEEIQDEDSICSSSEAVFHEETQQEKICEATVTQIEKEQETIHESAHIKKTQESNGKESEKIHPLFSFKSLVGMASFGVKYMMTSVAIFGVLLVASNYSAYSNILKSYVHADNATQESEQLLDSINAGEINAAEAETETSTQDILKKSKEEQKQAIESKEEETAITDNAFSMKSLVANLNKEDINLGIEIVPYENRIIIPKIGKNVPLVDIQETTVEGESELNNIFMKELESGLVRYPGSAKPGEKGNAFVFGHSSNFPWIAGEYNDVFARLGQMEVGDSVFSYYGQKKYKYVIKERKVISPNDVDILKRDKDKKELTLMTCWPIGTTLNRLILIGELVEE